MRLALLAVKVAVAAIVTNFDLVASEGTPDEANYDPAAFIGAWDPIVGLRLRVEKRSA